MQYQPSQVKAVSLGSWRSRGGWLRSLARNRFQLLGATLVGVVLPALLRPTIELPVTSFGALQNTLIGTFAAMLAGAYLRRRMTTYPGSGSIAVVLPAFGAAYSMAIVWFFFLRLEYSRAEFALSFILVLAWFAMLALLEPRLRRDRLLLLPFGKAGDLVTLHRADWVRARSTQDFPRGITGVVADLRANLPAEWERLLSKAALAGFPVYHWKQVAESLSGMVDIEHISENNLGSLLPSSVYLRLKYLIDVALAFVTLPVTLPVILLAASAIAIFDGGPVFFRQPRIGLGGHPFTILKFRTMEVGSENGQPFTVANDARVTRIGRVLRRYRIDELPQITNIVLGEMSWIGPRPESLPLAEEYESKVAFYSYRHIVRPGITGWAAVHQGNVAEVDAATTKLKYDFYYVKYFSPWLDLLIAAKTVRILLTGFGAR